MISMAWHGQFLGIHGNSIFDLGSQGSIQLLCCLIALFLCVKSHVSIGTILNFHGQPRYLAKQKNKHVFLAGWVGVCSSTYKTKQCNHYYSPMQNHHCITPVILPVVCPFLTYSASTGAPHCLLHSNYIPWIFHQSPLCFPISIFSRKYLRRCRSHDICKIRKCNNGLLHLPAEWYPKEISIITNVQGWFYR